jgi:hypothetical protein
MQGVLREIAKEWTKTILQHWDPYDVVGMSMMLEDRLLRYLWTLSHVTKQLCGQGQE